VDDITLSRAAPRGLEPTYVGSGSIVLKKDFGRGLRATLIQNQRRTRKIDSGNRPRGFDCCAAAACCGLFQQYRSQPVRLRLTKCFPVYPRKPTFDRICGVLCAVFGGIGASPVPLPYGRHKGGRA